MAHRERRLIGFRVGDGPAGLCLIFEGDMEPSVAAIRFTDGVWRDVFEEPTGRQYVLDHDGERVYGVWFIPRDEPEPDVVVGASA